MATIEELLKQLENAVYGKDVRQTIIDAVRQCYNDAISNGHTDMEVNRARGGYPNLEARQNAQDSEIRSKRNNDTPINMADLSQDVKLAMTGGSVAVVGDNAVGTSNLCDKSVTTEKLSGVSKEQYNYIEYPHSYIDSTTGEINSIAGDLGVTQAYEVTAEKNYTIYGFQYNYNKNAMGAYYAADGSLISTFRNSHDTAVYYSAAVPTGASFVRFTIQKKHLSSFVFNNPLVPKSKTICTDNQLKEAVGILLKEHIPEQSVGFKSLNMFQEKRYNKIDYDQKSNVVVGSTAVDGTFQYQGSYACSLKPEIEYYTTENISGDSWYLAFFDADGTYLGNSRNHPEILPSYHYETVNYTKYYIFTIPENAQTVLFVSNPASSYADSKRWIVEKAEYDSAKDIEFSEWVCTDKNFLKAIRGIDKEEKTHPELENKVWIALGDSYTRGMDGQFTALAAKYGMILDNRGVVSSSICGDTAGNKGFQPMWSRANTIVSNYTSGSGYSINNVAYTADDVGLITFMGGANDGFGVSTWLGNGLNDTDTNHIYGAVQHILKVFQENFPKAKIVVITQPSSYNRTVASITNEEDAKLLGFHSLAELQKLDNIQFSNYAMAQKENIIKIVAWAYGVPLIDMFYEFPSIFNPANRIKYWDADKLHLNTDGYRLIANAIEANIFKGGDSHLY